MAALYQAPEPAQPFGVIGQIDLQVPGVERLFHAKQIQFDDAAAIGKTEQSFIIKDGAVDVADDHARDIAALGPDKIDGFLGLVGLTARMDIDRCAGSLLCR